MILDSFHSNINWFLSFLPQSTFRGEYLTQAGLLFGTDADAVQPLNIEPAFIGEVTCA